MYYNLFSEFIAESYSWDKFFFCFKGTVNKIRIKVQGIMYCTPYMILRAAKPPYSFDYKKKKKLSKRNNWKTPMPLVQVVR